jgi:hypothetical protein
MLVDEPRYLLYHIDATIELLDLSNVFQQQIQAVGSTRSPKQMEDPNHKDPPCCFEVGSIVDDILHHMFFPNLINLLLQKI